VHLNPARAKNVLAASQQLSAFRWSSYPEYLKPPSQRPPWLRVDRLLGEHGIPKDSPAGRAEFEKRMELRRASETEEEFSPLLRGWCLGSEAFRRELLAQMSERVGPEHYGAEIRESAQQKAERLVQQELKIIGWTEAVLAARPKGAPQKLRIALRLRRETTMTLAWIAQRLQMGTKTHLTHLLYWHGRDREQRKRSAS
jgi:hypothetical protein